MESWVQSWRPRTNAFRDFSTPSVSKVLRLPRKKWCEMLHLSRKIILANVTIWCTKMQPISGNQHPDLLTSPMNMSLALRLPRKMHLSRSSSNDPRLPSFLEIVENPHVFLTFDTVHNPLCRSHETTSERPEVPRARQFLHFWLGIFFAPQWRALFRHLNFQKWLRTRRFSEPTFRATNHWKKTQCCFVTLLPFRAPASSFFSLFLFSDLLSSALLFSDSSHLCFSICPYCRKFDF